jgi:hypothetical protein
LERKQLRSEGILNETLDFSKQLKKEVNQNFERERKVKDQCLKFYWAKGSTNTPYTL